MGRGPWLVQVLTSTVTGLRPEIKDSCCQGKLRPLGGVQDWLGRTSAVQVPRGGEDQAATMAAWMEAQPCLCLFPLTVQQGACSLVSF